MSTYSTHPEEQEFIASVMAFQKGRPPRHLSIERDWSEDGERRTAATPYSTIRLLSLYDATGVFSQDPYPKDLEPWRTGQRWEAH